MRDDYVCLSIEIACVQFKPLFLCYCNWIPGLALLTVFMQICDKKTLWIFWPMYLFIYSFFNVAVDRPCGLGVRIFGFDSRRFQIFWEAAGLERGPLSLMTTEELLEGKVAAPVYKTEINDRGKPLRWPRDTLNPRKSALTSPTSGGRSVGIVRSRTTATV
jgi:hypothetical protein